MDSEEIEQLRVHVVAQMNLIGEAQNQQALSLEDEATDKKTEDDRINPDDKNNAHGLMKLVRRFINVREIDIDLIDQIKSS